MKAVRQLASPPPNRQGPGQDAIWDLSPGSGSTLIPDSYSDLHSVVDCGSDSDSDSNKNSNSGSHPDSDFDSHSDSGSVSDSVSGGA